MNPLILFVLVLTLPQFRQIDIKILDAERVINKDGGTWVAEKPEDLLRLMPNRTISGELILPPHLAVVPKRPEIKWEKNEVLVVGIIKLKINADIIIINCKWDEDGSKCIIFYKLGPEKPKMAMIIGGKRIEADYVTKSVGVIIKRPRQKPTVHLIQDK